jgi:endonuclease YncB( thermonuclease family)
MFLLGFSTAFANDLVGQASIIDGDTLEIHGTRIRLWGVDALRAASYAEVRIATCIAVARTQPMISTPLSRGDQ